jgi:hypothetical protein
MMATNGDSDEFLLSYMSDPDENYYLFPESCAENLLSAAWSVLADLFHEEVVNWEQVGWVVNACPTICGEKDKDGMLPLYHACYANLPYNVISFLVQTAQCHG